MRYIIISVLNMCIALMLSACAPGVTDGVFPITGSGGYSFSDTGGDGKYIEYGDSDETRKIVVEARVDAFLMIGDDLMVARRPLVVKRTEAGFFVGHVERTCEILKIETKTHKITKIDSEMEHGVSCH